MLFGSGKKWLNLPKWLNFIFLFHFHFEIKWNDSYSSKWLKWQWNEYQTEWWTYMNFIINLKQKRMWFLSIYHMIWLFIQLSFIHLSIQTNEKLEKGENKNNNQTQISYLFEGSYKYVWSRNSFQFDNWLWMNIKFCYL